MKARDGRYKIVWGKIRRDSGRGKKYLEDEKENVSMLSNTKEELITRKGSKWWNEKIKRIIGRKNCFLVFRTGREGICRCIGEENEWIKV